MEFEVGITIATHVPVEMVDLSNACSCCASADIYGDGFNFVNMGNTFRKVNTTESPPPVTAPPHRG